MNVAVALVGLFSALLGIGLSNGLATVVELRRRQQRQKDLLCAIHAEILAGVGAGAAQLTDKERSYALQNDSLFGTPDETDFVFGSVRSDLSILPIDVIHAVVQYYRLATQSNLMTRDLREPLFREQSQDERRKFVSQLLDVSVQQRQAGLRALSDIERTGHGLGLDLEAQRQRAVATVPAADLSSRSDAKREDGSGPPR